MSRQIIIKLNATGQNFRQKRSSSQWADNFFTLEKHTVFLEVDLTTIFN